MADITVPVNLDKFSKTIKDNPPLEGEDWNKSCFAELKLEVREHYSILQDDTCCYCKIKLRHAGYGEPIEHIVPKSDRPNWMFVPTNLALSCYPCNTKKNADNTLSASGIGESIYPTSSSAFLICHPHLDEFNDHIHVYHKYFLRPNSEKGRQTFEVCQLYRLNLPLDKAKQKDWQEEEFRIKVIEKVLLDASISVEVSYQCEAISKEIIRRAKKKIEIIKAIKRPLNNP